MKATGIVRRIDDLGRVVIPKEIRRTMRIREGDPLEIYTNSEGEVIFKKYSAISEMSENASYVADIMHKIAGCGVAIFDKDHVVAAAGVPKKEISERRASAELEELMDSRGQYFMKNGSRKFFPAEGVEYFAICAIPILANGDVSGAVVFLGGERHSEPNELQKSLVNAAAQFLAKKIE
ncbi:MAG: AbrB/MazE/SpoVT family DNA-binding domain-containing protein [Ruminococcus sp.]|nr:AbrB/MazE/SpoVT family DNA-binding domain-containing protein [Ruminococcus sp.]